MEETDHPPDLRYFISEKDAILVVVFAGSLSRASHAVLEQCQAEIVEKKPARVILMFRDIADRVKLPALAPLARLKAAIRACPAELRICGLHPEILKMLNDRGLLRVEEISNNLHEALLELLKPAKRSDSKGIRGPRGNDG